MESCLRTPEVFSLILLELRGFPFAPLEQEERVIYRNLALTCKWTTELALDELWKVHLSLDPLLLTFPSEVIYTEVPGPSDKKRPLARFRSEVVLQQKHWDRVLYYAPRIKRLFTDLDTDYANDDTWQLLNTLRPPGHPLLLPNLKRLAFRGTDQNLHNLRSLATPMISHIRMNFMASGQLLSSRTFRVSFFDLLPELCPSITSLSLDDFPPKLPFITKIGKTVTRWASLQIIQSENLTPAFLQVLSQIPSLREFGFRSILRGVVKFGEGTRFYALQTLKSRGEDVHVIRLIQLLQNITSQNLRIIQIAIRGRKGDSMRLVDIDWPTLFKIFPRFRTTLQSLVINPGTNYAPAWTIHDIETDFLQPLRTLQNLHSLELCHPQLWCLTVSDIQFDSLVAAFPQLQHLRISFPVTYECVLSLLRRCPQLKSLDLCLQTGTIPEAFEDQLQADEQNTAIRAFGVAPCPLSRAPPADTVKVAVFLILIFPNITSICREEEDKDNKDAWNEVERHIVAMRRLLRIRDQKLGLNVRSPRAVDVQPLRPDPDSNTAAESQ